jgi:hypothetical protein
MNCGLLAMFRNTRREVNNGGASGYNDTSVGQTVSQLPAAQFLFAELYSLRILKFEIGHKSVNKCSTGMASSFIFINKWSANRHFL